MASEKEVDGEESWISGEEYLLPRFNTIHSLAQQQIKFEDIDSAQQTYHRMLEVYDEINKSRLPSAQKHDAYKKLMDVFSLISDSPAHSTMGIIPFAKYILPTSLVIVVLLIIFFVKPEFSLTGLAAFGENSAPEWAGADGNFIVSGRTEINLDTYFKDPDGDRLTYLVTASPGIDASVSGSILTIIPDYGTEGKRIINVIASDLEANAEHAIIIDIR